MLQSAGIQVAEVTESLRRYGDTIAMDPRRRDSIEERLDTIQTIARKHRVAAEEIPALVEKLRQEHDELSRAEERGKELEQQASVAREEFLNVAAALSVARKKAAISFARSVSDAMSGLGMRDGVFARLDTIQTVARKHRLAAEEIPALVEKLRQEHDELSRAEERGKELEQQASVAREEFLNVAAALSVARKKAAISFARSVSDAMSGLGMRGGVFEVAVASLDDEAARPWGIDEIDFLISANPGQAPLPIAKIASGGELSRMSLAIQVIASDGSKIPTMVFDEIDSGVGGGVAEMVGRRLQELGINRQILCVTHLPQVASLASQHFRISKVTDGKSTRTRLHVLGKDERIEELARMLGGVEITRKTLDHAAEMLAGADQKRA